MTLEQIIDCDAATLEKMTDQELLVHFQKYLNVTRPEQAIKPITGTTNKKPTINPQMLKGMNILKGLGVDVELFPSKIGGAMKKK